MISIHALVKRATKPLKEVTQAEIISIHALVKRATATVLSTVSKLIISIHALVKRATHYIVILTVSKYYFNPRPREEGDFMKCFTNGIK